MDMKLMIKEQIMACLLKPNLSSSSDKGPEWGDESELA